MLISCPTVVKHWMSGSNCFFIQPRLAVPIVKCSSPDCLLTWMAKQCNVHDSNFNLSFFLSVGILRCRDLLLLQQQRKHAFHMIPLLAYIKPALYTFRRATIHLGSHPQCSFHGSMTSGVVFFHHCKVNLFSVVWYNCRYCSNRQLNYDFLGLHPEQQ